MSYWASAGLGVVRVLRGEVPQVTVFWTYLNNSQQIMKV